MHKWWVDPIGVRNVGWSFHMGINGGVTMSELKYINMWDHEVKEKLLWWQLKGLMQTVTGYGGKLSTTKMIKVNGRWHRIYVMQYSNSGSAYILVNKEKIFIREDYR